MKLGRQLALYQGCQQTMNSTDSVDVRPTMSAESMKFILSTE